MTDMSSHQGAARKPANGWLWTVVAVCIAIVLVLGAMAWWLVGAKVWTDDRTIRVADADANLREVLWTKPKSLNETADSDLFNSPDHEYEPSLSPDGTELYFVRGLASLTGDTQTDIYISHRRNNRWTDPRPLDGINTGANELGPRLTHDGEFLLFYSNREGGLGGYDIWAAKRTESGFGEPFNLGDINSPHNEFNPAPSPDGRLLLFTTNRIAAAQHKDGNRWAATIRHNPAATDYDLFVAEMEITEQGGEAVPTSQIVLSAPVELPGVNSDHHEGACCLTPGGDFLYFASNRPRDKRHDFDLYRCRIRPARDGTDEGAVFGVRIGEVESVRELNTPANETDPQLAMGGFQLYFSSDIRTQKDDDHGYDLFVAESREVFADRDGRPLPGLAWQWWVLLASLLLLLLLLLLMRGMDEQHLSLLQKCFIAAILLHLIGSIIASFVWLSKEVYEEYVKEDQEQVMVAIDVEMATEVDVKLSARQQQADLPVEAPSPQQTQRQALRPVMQQPSAQTQDIELPPTKVSATSPSMIVPQAARRQPSPAESEPAPSRPVTTPQTFTPQFAPEPVQPLAQVQVDTRVQTSTPTQTSRQAAESPPLPDAAQPIEVNAQPAQSSATSMAQAAAQKATATAEAVQATPAAPTAPNAEPAVTQPLQTQRITAQQPQAKVAESQKSAPKRTAEHSRSEAETATVQAPPSQAAPNSLATSTRASSVQSAPAETVPSTTAQPQGVEVQASLNTQAKALRSEAPAGPQVPQVIDQVAQRPTTAPRGQAETTDVNTPPAQAAAESVEQAASQTLARPNTEVIELSLAPPIEQPRLEAAPKPTAPLKAADKNDPPASDAPSRTLAQRVTNQAAAPAQKPVEAGDAPAAPAQPSNQSLASAANANSAPSSQAPTLDAAVQNPTTVTPRVGEPNVSTPRVRVDQQGKPVAAEATVRTDKQRDDARPVTASADVSRAASQTASPAQRDASDSKSLVASRQSQASTATEPSASLTPASPALPAPTDQVDVDLPAAPSQRVAQESAEPPMVVEPDAAPGSQRSADAARPSDSAADDALLSPADLPSPVALGAASLTPDAPTTFAAATGTVTAPLDADPAVQPLTGALGPSALATPEALFQRAPEQRKRLLEELGGTKESEEAVARALAFLAREQEDDGRWTQVRWRDVGKDNRGRDRHDAALTGLGALCFLAANHTPGKDGPYKDTVTAAIDFIISRQQPDGDLRAGGMMYDHGIATLAVAEAALMTGDRKYREAAIKAAKFIVEGQHRGSGGWRYSPREDGDTSVFGWQVMALHSVSQLGFEIPDKAKEGMDRWLERVSPQGSILAGYQGRNPSHAMSAEAAFSRILLGQRFTNEQTGHFNDYIFKELPGKGRKDYYYWYYATLSLSQMQGDAWDKWNGHIRDYLEKIQHRGGDHDGCWKDDTQWAGRGGLIYSTAMCCLSLEVYYRYLPMYAGNLESNKE